MIISSSGTTIIFNLDDCCINFSNVITKVAKELLYEFKSISINC